MMQQQQPQSLLATFSALLMAFYLVQACHALLHYSSSSPSTPTSSSSSSRSVHEDYYFYGQRRTRHGISRHPLSSPRIARASTSSSFSPSTSRLGMAISAQEAQELATKMRQSSSSASSQGRSTATTATTTPRKKYQRKRIPETERERRRLRQKRQEQYEKVMTVVKKDGTPPSIWSFESLFPQPVLDEKSIQQDLFGVTQRDQRLRQRSSSSSTAVSSTTRTTIHDDDDDANANASKTISPFTMSKLKSTTSALGGGSARMRVRKVPQKGVGENDQYNDQKANNEPSATISSAYTNLFEKVKSQAVADDDDTTKNNNIDTASAAESKSAAGVDDPPLPQVLMTESDVSSSPSINKKTKANVTISEYLASAAVETNTSGKVDLALTRLVEDRVYGMRREGVGGGRSSSSSSSSNDSGDGAVAGGGRRSTGKKSSSSSRSSAPYYDTSLMGDGAVQFRDGVRLGNPLRVNSDRLNYHAKRELRSNRLEEAQELYERAIEIDPRDGRAYLGLSRCAERRRDFKLARECLRMGLAQSVSCAPDGTPDVGANPFLLQALGCLEEEAGHLSQAETLYLSAVRSRPSHAASWVALGQLRTKRFRQGAAAGRFCYQSAERELQKVGLPPSAHVYTAWAAMEYRKCGDVRRARQLFKAALTADKRCSAAWLQLGVMEADNQNWREAELCFETVLKFDQRNTRVMQAYAIMESKRPDVNSRKVIGLFERALKANPRDAGVLQPYALFVDKLGDVDAARDLLRRGTEVNKRHAPVWQAWGVLETREGNPEEARHIFQQGIWACAQLTGGQSGGHKCARLWQAWGVLEASEGDYAAARRCFSRALDADSRNEATMTAWGLMEEGLDNLDEARHLFERSLRTFTDGTEEKKRMWRAYELMEQRAGNEAAAQEIYRRAMRESFTNDAVMEAKVKDAAALTAAAAAQKDGSLQPTDVVEPRSEKEMEVVRWDGGSSMKGEVWLNDGSIEGKVPNRTMSKKKVPSANTANSKIR